MPFPAYQGNIFDAAENRAHTVTIKHQDMKNQFTVLVRTIGSILVCSLLTVVSVRSQDVGINAFVSPGVSTRAGSANVVVRLQNFDTISVSSISIAWEVNGAAQAQAEYTRTLAAGASDTFTIGSVWLVSGTQVTLTASTINTLDANSANNSASRTVFVPLSGTYTVGGSSPNYSRITNAVTALTTYGISGPVTFNMRPQVDTVRFTIPAITGSSATNTITFQSENGDSSSVILRFTSTDTSNLPNAVMTIDGTDYLNIRKMTIERYGARAYARVIEIRNGSCFVNISNCRLSGSSVGYVTNSLAAVLYSSSTSGNDSSYTINRNLIERGSIGIYFNGTSTASPENGGRITDNIFQDQFATAIDVSYQANLIVSGNTITTASPYTAGTAIKLNASIREHRISKNRISGNFYRGLYMIDCSGINTRPGIVSNNFIQATDSFGIRLTNGYYQDFLYNSVNTVGPNSTAWDIGGTGVTNRIMNNVFAATGGGQASRIANHPLSGIFICRNNDLYTTGGILGTYNGTPAADLSLWQLYSQRDSNSVSVNPEFTSSTDLHALARGIDSRGIALTSVIDDIDGQSRNGFSPDMGADEFAPLFRDVAAIGVLSPVSGGCGNDTTRASVIISNPGSMNETGFMVYLTTSTGSTVAQLYTDQLAPGTTDTVFFGNTVSTTAGGAILITAYTANPVDDNRTNDTLRVTRNIIAPPAAPVTTGGSVCTSGRITLGAVGGGAINWYNALSGGTQIGSGNNYQTPVITSTTVYYASTVVSGCESARSAATATVNAPPTVSLGNDTSVTQGAQVSFSAGSGFVSYFWSTGQTTPSINVSLDGCYTVTVTDANGCTGTDEACLTTVQNTDLSVINILSPISGYCGSSTTPVVVQVINYGPFAASNITVNVVVSGGGNANLTGFIAGPMNVNDTVTLTIGNVNTSNGGAFTVSATSVYGVDNNAANNNLSATFNLVAQPVLPIVASGYRCGDGVVQLSAAASLSILWYDAPSGGNLIGSGNVFTTPSLTQTTSYYAQAGNVCIGQSRATATATIHPLPNVYIGPDTSLVNPPYTLDAGAGFSTYIWNNNTNAQTLTVTSTGTYSVIVTDQNGCTATDDVFVQFTVGVEEAGPLAAINLYPNPNQGRFTLTGDVHATGELTLRIFDSKGASVVAEVIPTNAALRHDVDVSGLAKGIYTAIVSDGTFARHLRIVVN
ncbi:MAG: hypothetical protein RL213_1767 [Bacteroidota bacterium]|jgi:hypothetical protein